MLSVLTAATLDHVEELFQFYQRHGITNVGLLLEEQEGVHKNSTAHSADHTKISQLWADVLTYSTKYAVNVREVEHMIPRLLGRDFHNTLNSPGDIITIAHNGAFSTYAPEMLEQTSERYGDFVIGNVLRDTFAAGLESPKNQMLLAAINAGVDLCQATCDHFSVCKGGSPSNKHSENGSLDTSETEHCRRTYKLQADAWLSTLERAAPPPQALP